ncbi:bacillithiol transferase BstA [soil metagenome]
MPQEKDPLYNLKYPIGEFKKPEKITREVVNEWIKTLEVFPTKLKKEVEGLNDDQLEMKYRDGGWTIRQIVHHTFDSHVNSYIRFKLAVTEDNPTIRPYNEAPWAELEEAKNGDISLSMPLTEALHKRWTVFLRNMKDEEWKRKLFHPEHNKSFKLNEFCGMYAWHCEHHLAHIRNAKESKIE